MRDEEQMEDERRIRSILPKGIVLLSVHFSIIHIVEE